MNQRARKKTRPISESYPAAIFRERAGSRAFDDLLDEAGRHFIPGSQSGSQGAVLLRFTRSLLQSPEISCEVSSYRLRPVSWSAARNTKALLLTR